MRGSSLIEHEFLYGVYNLGGETIVTMEGMLLEIKGNCSLVNLIM